MWIIISRVVFAFVALPAAHQGNELIEWMTNLSLILHDLGRSSNDSKWLSKPAETNLEHPTENIKYSYESETSYMPSLADWNRSRQ